MMLIKWWILLTLTSLLVTAVLVNWSRGGDRNGDQSIHPSTLVISQKVLFMYSYSYGNQSKSTVTPYPTYKCLMYKKAMVTSLGKTFVLSFPKLSSPEVVLLMYTLDSDEFNVLIALTSGIESPFGNVTVRKGEATKYALGTDKVPVTRREFSSYECVVLIATGEFGLHVHMKDGSSSTGVFMAVPVEAWGKEYHVVTLKSLSFFIIVTSVQTKVRLLVPSDPSETVDPSQRFNGEVHEIDKFYALALSECVETDRYKNRPFTGSIVLSLDPVGVISGSCTTNYDTDFCTLDEKALNKDLAIEMLLPAYMYGKEFVTVYSPWVDIKSSEVLIITTRKDKTEVTVKMTETKMTYFSETAGNVTHIEVTPVIPVRNAHIASSKPICVVQVQTSLCGEPKGSGKEGGPSMVLLMHNELFYNSYVWMRGNDDALSHYIVVVISALYEVDDLTLNDQPMAPRLERSSLIHGSSHKVSYYGIKQMDVYAIVTASLEFGCYAYGGGLAMSYFYSAGFRHRKEPRPLCTAFLDGVADDQVDNDCDGLIDEEGINYQDDDGDSLVDEDVSSHSNCTEYGKWGKGCRYRCSQYCEGPCDKSNGACSNCIPGRREPVTLCKKECDTFYYGQHCIGDCREKCKSLDCVDRVTGLCPFEVSTTAASPEPDKTTSFWYVVMVIILISLAIGALVGMFSGKQEDSDILNLDNVRNMQYMNEKILLWDDAAVQAKRRRSGSNVDEPDAYNMEYILKGSIYKEGKYFPISQPSEAKTKTSVQSGTSSKESLPGNVPKQSPAVSPEKTEDVV